MICIFSYDFVEDDVVIVKFSQCIQIIHLGKFLYRIKKLRWWELLKNQPLGKRECISVGRVRCRDGVMSGSGSRNFSCFKIERSRLFSWKSSFETLPSKSKLLINFVSYVLSSAEKRWCLSSCSYYTKITVKYFQIILSLAQWHSVRMPNFSWDEGYSNLDQLKLEKKCFDLLIQASNLIGRRSCSLYWSWRTSFK